MADRRGFSLLELVLVLALVVIVGSLAAPAAVKGFSSTRLRRAGDQVLAALADCRRTAVATGLPQEFRFQADGGQYQYGPWSQVAVSSEATPGSDSEVALPASTQLRLPDEIVFGDGRVLLEVAETDDLQVASTRDDRDAWSRPVVFRPDGGSTHASLVLSNDNEQHLRITIRGLTGLARASDVLSRDELEEAER
jgi:prepilin-type N-terminal cleavage/methylation domain-containing protein